MICRSGIEESYTEREQLLQEAYDLRMEFDNVEKRRKSKLIGITTRLIASENIPPKKTDTELEICISGVSLCETNFASLICSSAYPALYFIISDCYSILIMSYIVHSCFF